MDGTMASARKDEVAISIRVHRTILNLVDRAAFAEGKTRSEFIIESVKAEALRNYPLDDGQRCPICGHTE